MYVSWVCKANLLAGTVVVQARITGAVIHLTQITKVIILLTRSQGLDYTH